MVMDVSWRGGHGSFFLGALYHVIARGNQGQTPFRETEDYRLYLKYLRE